MGLALQYAVVPWRALKVDTEHRVAGGTCHPSTGQSFPLQPHVDFAYILNNILSWLMKDITKSQTKKGDQIQLIFHQPVCHTAVLRLNGAKNTQRIYRIL